MSVHTTEVLAILALTLLASSQGIRVTSCNKNPATDIVTVNWFSAHPNPIQVPGDLSISGSFLVKQPITGNLQADVTISKKFGSMWIDLPCVNVGRSQLGSCTYNNLCGHLARINGTSCPRIMSSNGIPCKCPIPAGTYAIPQTIVPVNLDILGFSLPVLNGQYQASIRLMDADTRTELLCYDVDLELTDPPSARPFGSIGRFFTNLFG